MNFPTGCDAVPDFPWGPVVKVHEIAGLAPIVEHYPQIFRSSCGTGDYDRTRTVFCLAQQRGELGFRWEGFNSLNHALIAAVCVKESGTTVAFKWIVKLIEGAQ